jgi:hypothetical protein
MMPERIDMASIRSSLCRLSPKHREPIIIALEQWVVESEAQSTRIKELEEAAEMLWVVIANVSGGDWTQQAEDWQIAARRWSDNYHKALKGEQK